MYSFESNLQPCFPLMISRGPSNLSKEKTNAVRKQTFTELDKINWIIQPDPVGVYHNGDSSGNKSGLWFPLDRKYFYCVYPTDDGGALSELSNEVFLMSDYGVMGVQSAQEGLSTFPTG